MKPIVVKLGGSTLGSHDTALEDLITLQKRKVPVAVVHGGGKEITEWLGRMGVSARFVRGLRVTDAETLKVVVAVLAGLVNKELVAAIEAQGGHAIGRSGVDGGLLQAQVKDAELGYVGEVVKVNPAPLTAALGINYIPLVAPLGLQLTAESGKAGSILNINGDTAAGEIAAALGAEKLIFLTDVAGVCDKSGNLIPRLSAEEARGLIASGVASGGMIPKLEACLCALSAVPVTRIIDGRAPHALLREVEGGEGGTTVVAGQRS